MKRASLVAALATCLAPLAAHAAVLATWTFETSIPATAGPFAPEVGSGAATGAHAGASTYSSPAGNGSAHSFSSNVWAVGDYYQFTTSTTGYQGVFVDWDQTSSNTGPRDFELQYSLNGSTFTTFGGTITVLANGASPNASWNSTTNQPAYHFSVDLSSVSALDNAGTIYIRLANNSAVSANGGTVASGGTDRVDNFNIVATPIPEPATLGLLILGTALINRRRRA